MREYSSRAKHWDFIILDILCVEASFVLAYLIRFGTSATISGNLFLVLNLLLLLLHLFLVFAMEGYSGILRRGYGKELKKVIFHNVVVLSLAMTALFFAKWSASYSRLLVVYFFLFNTVLMYVVRTIHKRYLLKGKKRPIDCKMLLVAYKEDVPTLVEQLKSYNYSDFVLDGICILDDDTQVGEMFDGVEVVTNKEHLLEYVKTHVVDRVFLKCKDKERKKLMDTLYHMGVQVHMCLDFFLEGIESATMENINGNTVITAALHQPTFKQKVVKRLMDICGGLVGLAITAILTIIFGPIIKIQSPGPIFFKQKRMGQNGRTFYIYKFRSMYPDAEARKAELMKDNKMSGHMFKMDNDPRIIPIGRFMRKTSLDEFPQFLNVLLGDMSLVGTRPPTVDEYEKYELHHRSRLAIKPGLTGLWQISGRSDITDFEEVVALDNQYIRCFCLSYDIKIILKTIWIVLAGRGAS